MWTVYEHRNALKGLKSLPVDIFKRYEKWKDIVAISGPHGLSQIKGFNDEPLKGKWKRYRPSRLNMQFRIICRIKVEQLFIQVVKVTPHDYRRK